MNVYFDNAATTPLRPEVIATMHTALNESFGNPSSTHTYGRHTRAQIESARKEIAAHFNAHPYEIVFTSGGTESDNALLRCAVEDLAVTTIISSEIEHHAILHTLDYLAQKGCKIVYLPVDHQGKIDYDQLDLELGKNNEKKLVTLMHINNEIGTLLDLERVANACQQHDALFHTDAVQGVGHYAIDLSAIPIDFMSAAAHKFHGPKGIGFSFIRKNSGLNSFLLGGGQERGHRAGTESVHNILGMARALSMAYEHLEEERAYILTLKKYAIERLRSIFPKVHFNGCCSDHSQSTYTLLNVCLPVAPEQSGLLDFQLDLKGIACSKGSACQSGSTKGSHVIRAIQCESRAQRPSLRFSFSMFNTKEEIDYLMDVLSEFTPVSVS